MRLSTKRLSLAALLIGALASLLPADDRAVAAAIGDKQSRLLAVVAELRSRPSLEWSADRLLARQRTLDLLERYAHQADFTVHHAAWPRDLPLFIDEHGTRCALASVLDGVGEGALVLQLAATCNDAYLNEIAADPAVVATLDRLGITLDEAAYIQGPGIRFDSPEPTFTGPTGLTGNSLDNGVGGPPNETTGRGRPGITGAAAGVTRRANGDATGLSVTGWWAANLDRFLPVRELYRGESAQTPAVTPGNWRVSGDERAALRGRLAELARSDRDLKATALGMWARTSDGSDAPAIVTETLALLADPHHPDRAWAPLLLAILGREEASAALAAMVADDAAGRKLVGGAAGVPEDLRALAAIALGRSGSAVGPL
ncbi:MAG: hypothetical protein FJ293_01985, partial [Planctomycetes bacterium]|nr:hypothetical protein [Planctomycetota bacterium]